MLVGQRGQAGSVHVVDVAPDTQLLEGGVGVAGPPRTRTRLAELGDSGWIEFTVDQKAGLLRVYRLVWIG